jgi:hypothetical protein
VENTKNSLTAVAAQEGPSVSVVVGDTYRIVIGSELYSKSTYVKYVDPEIANEKGVIYCLSM